MSLAFLCPVKSVREKAEGSEKKEIKFSKALKERTADVHASSDALVQAKMGLAFADPKVWGALVGQFGLIYSALEKELEGVKDHPHIEPVAALLRRLRRSEAFDQDVEYFTSAAAEPPLCSGPCAAVIEYTSRIKQVAREEPALLLSYAQAMYMALLSGGQIIRKLQRGAMGLGESDGGAIFVFEQIPLREQGKFKKEFAAALDQLPLDETIREKIINEKRNLFARNDAIVREVVSLAPWTAYLTLARRFVGYFTVAALVAIPVVWIGVNMAVKKQ